MSRGNASSARRKSSFRNDTVHFMAKIYLFRNNWQLESNYQGAMAGSHPLNKPIQHPLLPRPVKIDRQLVALDPRHIPVAELDVEHPVADRERTRRVDLRLGDQFARDHLARRPRLAIADLFDLVAGAVAPVVAGGVGLVGLGALPARRGVAGGEGFLAVEAGLAVGVAAVAAVVLFSLGDLDMGFGQFVEEA